jgi:hypothetical protein
MIKRVPQRLKPGLSASLRRLFARILSAMAMFRHLAVGDTMSGMHGWFERWQKRRRELAEGTDADLMQSNRRRFRVAFGLIGLAFVMGLIDAKVRLPATLEIVFRVGAGISGVVGIVLAKWAQQEHTFLTRPDLEGPPEIFKNSSD